MSGFLNIVVGHICGNLATDRGTATASLPAIRDPVAFAHDAEAGIAVHCTSDQVQFTYMVARPLVAAAPVGHWAVCAETGLPARARVGQLA